MNTPKRGRDFPPDMVWPPPPRRRDPVTPVRPKDFATPRAVALFYFTTCIRYGFSFGAIYGGGFGLLFYIAGAISGMLTGGMLGFILGIFEGLILSAIANRLIHHGQPLYVVSTWIRRTAPLCTLLLGAVIVWIVFQSASANDFPTLLSLPVYAIAIFASWHAACVASNKCMEEYDEY